MGWLSRLRGGPEPEPGSADAPAQGAAGLAPLQRVACAQARQAHQHNPHHGWAARAQAANAADPQLACHRIWTAHPELTIRPKFGLDRSASLFAMGSCFAREVEDALVDLGMQVPTHCDALFDAPLLQAAQPGQGPRPRSYLNRYNTMSMRDELRHLLGLEPALEQGLLSYPLDKGSCADLHYSQSLPQVDPTKTLARRQLVREALGPQLRQTRTLVITLGMAECWYDQAAQRYLNNTPGPRVMAQYGDQLEVHLTRYEQHLAALEDIHSLLLQSWGPDFRLLVTVSPVPLERSFLDQDIIQTHVYSKAMLRTAAQSFALAHDNVDYFPSYEMVTYAQPDSAWVWDHRHVKPGLVAHIMQRFVQAYFTAGPQSAALSGQIRAPS